MTDRFRRVITSIGRDNPYHAFPPSKPSKPSPFDTAIDAAINAVEETALSLAFARVDFHRAKAVLVAATSAAAKAVLTLAVLKGCEYFGRL